MSPPRGRDGNDAQRTGPTRIPVFGTRIPIPGQLASEDPRIVSPVKAKQFREVSRKDIGKKVRVAEKEGVLRFVGNVHFTQGVWCGVELFSSNGKNDGCVRGVRYFACPDSRGLMAPLCKVLLVDDIEFEEEDDVHSGPHSMLFGIKEGTYIKDFQRIEPNATFINVESDSSSEDNDTKKLIRSETYERLNKIQPNKTIIKNLARTSTYDISGGIAHTNTTFQIIDTPEKSSGIENLTYLNGNNFPDIVNSSRIFNDVGQSIDDSGECGDDDNTTIVLNKTISRDLQNTTAVLQHSFNELDYSSPTATINHPSSAELNGCTPKCYVGNKIKKPYNLLEIDRKATLQRTKPKNESQLNDSNKCLNETHTLNSKLKLTKLLTIDSSPMPNETQLAHPTSLFADSDVESSPRRRRVKISSSAFAPGNEDDSTKRDSLEFEESLGILTPEQMTDLTGFSESRTSSPENIGSLPHDFQSFVNKFQSELKVSELPSPNLIDTSVKDVSLGIIDENMLLSLAIKSETTVNMELRFDSVGKGKSYTITRLEQTPSPEDLPLDPTPVIECESKIEPIKSKTASSFITSITSITSLDTGYQGDGEMSRPASRGADHSPLTRRPTQRPQPRRPDPLTDSDFYTESDADNHEEHPLRGGRLARVIDGTLYGVDPQAAADIYVNNRENMDSSGIFTDIEGNTRTDELSSAENENQDISPSPSDTSSKTISNNSQNNAPAILNKTMNKSGSIVKHNNNNNNNNSVSEKKELIIDEMPLKRKSPTPSSTASSPASVRSPRHTPRENNNANKYKMPKRNVTSKVKAALETNNQQRKEVTSITPKKTVGRWDAVMNKISKNTSSLKEIKSKVFTNNASNTSARQATTPNNKLRRGRTRSDMTITNTNNAGSLHSSASDLSSAAPAKRIDTSSEDSDSGDENYANA
ncbi:hypothetical protein FQA39_LY13957 [Lamprigera yunnana]|nr:hypothetical protein FQA39_LY13957 [Lamprigera yunnana]